jgi:hypothetical protein
MFDPRLTLIAVTCAGQAGQRVGVDSTAAGDDAARLESAARDVAQLPLIRHLSEVLPVPDLFVGGIMLIIIVLIHAAGVRTATSYVLRRSRLILAQPSSWRADLLMSSTVFFLLGLHLLELAVWAAALVYSGLVADWRAAGFFAGNTYTTIGYGSDILPIGWKMLAPIIAISGLFTFGWSGSVLVDLVGRCQKIKDAATVREKTARRAHA